MVALDDRDDPEAKPLVFRNPLSLEAGAPPRISGRDGDVGDMGVEAGCIRKMNWRILGLLFIVAMMCYIDRTNLAFASVNMTADLGFNPQVYGLGSGLFFVGYSLAMVPVQLLVLRAGAPRALACIVTAWGATAMAFSAISSKTEFYVLRLMLGAFESGAFPAIWFYINSWYPPSHITLSYSVIEAAVGAANCVAAPMAAVLLLLDGTWGLRGWQVLFFVEGLPSVLLGVLIYKTLPRHIHDARFLSNAERSWLAASCAGARKHAEQAEALGSRRMLAEALANRRLWLIMAVGIMKNAAMTGVLFFAPKLVDAIMMGAAVDVATGGVRPLSPAASPAAAAAAAAGGGSSHRALLGVAPVAPTSAGVRAALLTAVPFVLAAGTAVWLGRRSQQKGERCLHMAVPWCISSFLFIAFSYAASHSPQAGFACLSLAVVTATSPNALLNTLAGSVSHGPAQAVSLSLYNAVANVGGLVGPLFIGFVVHHTGVYTVAMQGLGLLLAGAAALVWYMQRWGL